MWPDPFSHTYTIQHGDNPEHAIQVDAALPLAMRVAAARDWLRRVHEYEGRSTEETTQGK